MTLDFPLPAENKAELLERILVQRLSLETLLGPVTAEQMVASLADWTIKDHLAHLTAWAGKAVYVLVGREPYQGLGLLFPPADLRDYESINAMLHDRDLSLELEEVVQASGERHGELVAALMMASESDMRRPMPPEEPDGRTVLAVVAANSYEHSIEHEAMIRELLAQDPSR